MFIFNLATTWLHKTVNVSEKRSELMCGNAAFFISSIRNSCFSLSYLDHFYLWLIPGELGAPHETWSPLIQTIWAGCTAQSHTLQQPEDESRSASHRRAADSRMMVVRHWRHKIKCWVCIFLTFLSLHCCDSVCVYTTPQTVFDHNCAVK